MWSVQDFDMNSLVSVSTVGAGEGGEGTEEKSSALSWIL